MSTLAADLAANQTVPSRIAIRLFRLSQALPGPFKKLATFALWVVCGADIPARTQVGAGLRLPHGARGVVVHPDTVIGSGVTIYHGVTLGMVDASQAVPVVEDDCYIGVGAVILGGVRLGRGCKIGANAVVLHDVPAGATAVGAPARALTSA